MRRQTIAERDAKDPYRARRLQQQLSPDARYDPFDSASKTPGPESVRRTYVDHMREINVINQQKEIAKKISDMSKSGELDAGADSKSTKKRRWDQAGAAAAAAAPQGKQIEDHLMATPAQRQIWDATPAPMTPGHESETPGRAMGMSGRRRWDETPRTERG